MLPRPPRLTGHRAAALGLPLTCLLLSATFTSAPLFSFTSHAFSFLCPSVKPAFLLPLPLHTRTGGSHLCLSAPLEHFLQTALLMLLFFHLLNGNDHVLFIFVFPAPSTGPGIQEVLDHCCSKNE